MEHRVEAQEESAWRCTGVIYLNLQKQAETRSAAMNVMSHAHFLIHFSTIRFLYAMDLSVRRLVMSTVAGIL
jgi:hypothetical protein